MENYIVSARKYRPTTFESVVGQRALTTTLKNAIATGKLAHAYLFCGPRGVGKTTCARIFAKTINCLNPTADGEACNECESCRAFNEQRSYNIHELDAASNNSVDDIRQLVEQVRIPPQMGRYKVYIIDEVHMLSASAFNAFLKTLEEPPRHAIFILATTEKHKILPTILSRCQIYDFNRIGVEDTVAHLAYVASKEGITAEPEALHVIALKADGGMRDALSIFDQVVSFTGGHITYQSVIENLNVLDYEYYFRLTDYLLERRISEALLLFNEVLNKGFDGSHFITGLSSHFRDVLVSKDESTLPLLQVGAGIRERYKQQASRCPAEFLYQAMKLSNDCDLNYRASKNKRLLVELTLIQIAQLNGHTPPDRPQPRKDIQPLQTSPQPAPAPKPAASPQTKAPGATATPPPRQAEVTHPMSTAQLLARQAQQEKKMPVMKKDKLGISIKQAQQAQAAAQQSAEAAATAQQAAVTEQNEPFDLHDLRYHWHEFANLLPQEQIAIAKRMQTMRLNMTDAYNFEVTVDNDIVAKEFNDLKPALLQHMRTTLKNSHITMSIRLSEKQEKVLLYSKKDRYQYMAQKNHVLEELRQNFGLELD